MVQRVLGPTLKLPRALGRDDAPSLRWALLLNNAFTTANAHDIGSKASYHGTFEVIWRPLAFDGGQILGARPHGLGRFNIQIDGSGVVNVVSRLGDTTLVSRGVTAPLTLGKLYQLSVVCDHDNEEMAIYLNGWPNMAPDEGSASHTSGTRINFGAFNDSATDPTRRHHSELYQVRFWDTLRTPEQIKELMFKELSPPITGLRRYYSVTEGEGNTLFAKGSHTDGKDATIVGGLWVRRPRLQVQPQVPPPPVPLAEMWVSAVSGSPFGDGSEGDPFDTLERASFAIQDGSKVHLERGSHFRGMLTIDADDVEVDAYGSGPMPLADCSDPVPPSAWAPTDGLDDVYEASWSHAVDASIGLIGVWEESERLEWRDTQGEVEAEPGTFHAESTSSNPAMVYVHPKGSTDPRADGKLYEITRRDHGFFNPAARTGLVLEDVQARRNGHNDGAIVVGRDAEVRRCLAIDGTKHNMLLRAGSLAEDCAAWLHENSSRVSSASLFVAFDNSAAAEGKDVTFVRCWGVTSGGALLISHTDSTGRFDNIVWEGGGAVGTSLGFFLGGAVAASVEGCFMEGLNRAFEPVLDYFVTRNVTVIGPLRVQAAGNVGEEWEVRDLRAQMGVVSGAAFFSGIDGALDIESSAVVFGTNTSVLFDEDEYADLRLHDSILVDFSTNYNYQGVSVVPDGAGNVWSRDGTMRWHVDEVEHTTLAALQAAHAGLEANSAQVTSAGFLAPALVASEGVMITSAASPARDGRAAGSALHIPRPRWDWMINGWAQGFILPMQPPGESFEVEDAYVATAPDTAVEIDVAQRSRPTSGQALVLQSLDSASHGSRTIISGTRVEYTPDPGFEGVDSFGFSLSDGQGGPVQSGTCHIGVGVGSSS